MIHIGDIENPNNSKKPTSSPDKKELPVPQATHQDSGMRCPKISTKKLTTKVKEWNMIGNICGKIRKSEKYVNKIIPENNGTPMNSVEKEPRNIRSIARRLREYVTSRKMRMMKKPDSEISTENNKVDSVEKEAREIKSIARRLREYGTIGRKMRKTKKADNKIYTEWNENIVNKERMRNKAPISVGSCSYLL
ncbi:hypothetical protein DASC09_042200 [Saccharomycopsis crataegensis]|uniref:Uncharacterized protein n=1 Tax=Saccharomycopsis crataegensis TaxID=43959 RepID=A0AAV5QPM4_9ASCO|nr:hypothetical protein DASC09_042200 [Saccharomycopsis crataegensis]